MIAGHGSVMMDKKDLRSVSAMATKTKYRVIRMIEDLPEKVSVDGIVAELFFRLQVDAGLKELDEGRGVPHKSVEKRISKWLKK
ncbi:MAG: hypothetical protein QME32_07065 [Endomicrobiia bacterium]|nr:hypothetical protein [Endomicrobiia bacterium]